MYQPTNPKDNAAQLLCLYLAEEMRMRAISPGEAKEIARALVAHKNLIDNEEHMLRFVIELSKDHPRLIQFEKKLALYLERKGRNDAEKKVTQFVAAILEEDQNLALAILDDAIDSNNSLTVLTKKYPQFAQYLALHPNN
jgi:hypothetical protein